MPQPYRSDVQGLRAVAVLPILAFHLNAACCPGGFIGVDIFFVISGYLITKLILADGADFSFKAFYIRRFFRLYPALLVTLLVSLIAGWKMLGPTDYLSLAQSAVSAALGLANIYFYFAVDYFNAASHAHHLLHTWSLSVEEQLYLFWPLILLLARLWLGRVWLVAALVGIASFVTLQIVQPDDPHLAFYMMPFRAFEFIIGASLIRVEERFRQTPDWLHTVVGCIGAIILAVCFVQLNSESRWPGHWSLAVALATGMLILAGMGRVWQAILSFRPLQFFGQISYSLYLVHWPIITLYRHHIVTDPNGTDLLLLGAGSIVAATLLHYGVEQPFRQRRSGQIPAAGRMRWLFRPRHAASLLAVSLVGFLSFSGYVIAKGGVPARLNNSKAQFLDGGLTFAGDICSNRRHRCQIGDRAAQRTVYVVGDSHALNLLFGLDQFFRKHRIKGIVFYDNGCLFLSGTTRFLKGVPDRKCRQNVADAYAHLANTKAPVILAGNYAGYRNIIGPADAEVALKHTEAEYYAWLTARLRASLEMLKANGRSVVLIKQTYSTGINLPKCLSQPGVSNHPGEAAAKCKPRSLQQARSANRRADALIDDIGRAYASVVVIDPKALFCSETQCTTQRDGKLLFRDATHLTNSGSVFLAEAMRKTLLKTLSRP